MIYEFAATQSYNGYDKPWPPGGGKNLANIVYGSAVPSITSGEMVSVYGWSTDFIEVDNSKEYAFAGEASGTGASAANYILFYDTDKTYLGYVTKTSYMLSSYTNWESTAYVKLRNDSGSYATLHVQIEQNSTQTAWTPYENICPPEGFNIWDPTNQEYIQVYAGYVNANTRELYLRPVYEEYAGEELVGPWMSSLDPYEEDTTPSEGAFVIDFGGELTSFEITPFMLQTLLDSLGIRQHFTDGAGLLNKLMDQAQGRVRSEEELVHLSRPLNVIAIGDQLPAGLTFKPISKDVLPGLPGKFIR